MSVPLRSGSLLAAAALAAGVASAGLKAQAARPAESRISGIPDTSGWGVHVLALARAPDGAIWAGTYGEGIFVLRPGSGGWERIVPGDGSISWGFVHAFAFQGRDIWYGTIGNGWGVSRDGGRTWSNWTGAELGKRWLYVTPNGIVVKGDTVYVATADGITWSADRGSTWGRTPDSGPGSLPNRYVLAISHARGAGVWVSTLRGVGRWDPTYGWRRHDPPPASDLGGRVRAIFPVDFPGALVPFVPGSERCVGALRPRGRRSTTDRWECLSLFERGGLSGAAIRALAGCEGVLCAGATSQGALYGTRTGLVLPLRAVPARARDVYAALAPAGEGGDTLFGTACGLMGRQSESCFAPGDSAGVTPPEPPRHTWFARPIALTDQPFVDQTYRYGSTMGGNFQQHQGVEFNNPAGTSVLAVGQGVVVRAGPAEQGALTVAIRHDSVLVTAEGRFHLFSVYYHNSALLVREGQRVTRGMPIARVGSTGRATNDHLHLEIHAAPGDDVRQIVDPDNRYPAWTRNPELWIEPLPGTGIVAGLVLDSRGNPLPRARVYGLVKPVPQETPFSFAETYGDRTRGDPAYGENFAVSDVPPGEYVLGVMIEGRRVFKRVRVDAGRVTWVVLRP
jgi:hypothetical protein